MLLGDNPNQTYRLRWNTENSSGLNLSEEFRDLRESSEYFDVSVSCALSAGGSRSLRAHKIILSAYSSVFRDMFRQNTTQGEPMIFLKGVSPIDLSNLLDFMYNGEVNVSKANLSSFLSVAEELQVKGLQLNNKTAKKPDPPIKRPSLAENALSSLKRPSLEAMQKYLKKERLDRDENDPISTKNSLLDAARRRPQKLISPKEEVKAPEEEEDDDYNEPVPDDKVGVVDDFIKKLKTKKILGNQKRAIARCRICLKETRTDKIRPHIRGAHATYLLPIPKDDPVTSSNDDGMDNLYNDSSKQGDTVSSSNDATEDNFDQYYDKLMTSTFDDNDDDNLQDD